MLKWAGEKDAKQYLSDQAELRRQSLAFRNAEGKRHRDIDEDTRAQSVLENAQNEELNAACESILIMKQYPCKMFTILAHQFLTLYHCSGQRDVPQYKKECAARDCASLRLNGKEKFSRRMEDQNDKEIKLQEDHDSHLLDTGAWQDVNDYVKECSRRNRLSLALRAKEKRHHKQVKKEQAEQRIYQQQLYTHYRSVDARYVEMAKLKEKARIALESFNRSPTCSFGGNPFAALLG